MPLSAAHETLSNTILYQRNWPDKETLTDDEIALHAQAYLEDLSRECERLRKYEHVHKGQIKHLRKNLKVMHKERDEAEDALLEHVDSFRKMKLRAHAIKNRRAYEHGNGEQAAGQHGDVMEAEAGAEGERSVTRE